MSRLDATKGPHTTMPFEAPDPLLRPRDAAKRLGVCTETIWRWMRKGAIAFEQVGPYRKKRIRSSVVEALIRRGTGASGTA